MNKFYLVRHAENRANLTKEFSCRKVDYPLTERGMLQARQTAAYFRELHLDAIYTSPLRRAWQTAAQIAAASRLSYTIVENFRELNVGRLEELGGSQASWEMYFDVVRAWRRGEREARFPGGENYWEARDRMQSGLALVMQDRKECTLAVVIHGGLITATIQDICPDVDLEVIRHAPTNNCAITEIDFHQQDGCWIGELVRWADTSHLYGDAARLVSGLP